MNGEGTAQMMRCGDMAKEDDRRSPSLSRADVSAHDFKDIHDR